MLTDANGSTNVVRYDYQPFGGELPASYGGRTAAMGYPTIMDTLNPRYTGKNRDSESSLDWFEIRSMSSAQGRFQSVDPGNAGADPSNPQTWNMYAYVGNNPLSYTDPSGAGVLDFLSGIGNAIQNFFGFGTPSLSGVINAQINAANQGPWNEQLPSGLGGPSLTTGGVCNGSGVGPCINSILRPDPSGSASDLTFYALAIGYLQRDYWMAKIIGGLQASSTVYTVRFINNDFDRFCPPGADPRVCPTTNSVYWNSRNSLQTTQGGCQSAALGLGHELAHAYEWDKYPYWFDKASRTPSQAYGNYVEKWAIQGPEASAARSLGESQRYDHSANWTFNEVGPLSRGCK